MKATQTVKPIVLIVLFYFILFCPLYVTAQIVGGGGGQTNTTNSVSNSNSNEDDIFNDLQVGAILPQGLFAKQYMFPSNGLFSNLTLPFKGAAGIGASTGITLQYSLFNSLAKLHLSPAVPARLGILFGLDMGYISTNWSNVDWSTYDMTESGTGFFYYGLKIGPQFNINPMDNMGVCFYVTVDPYLTLPGGVKTTYDYTDAAGNNTDLTYNVSDTTILHLNINVSAGIKFYYKSFIMGIEYNWVHTKYNGAAKEDGTYTTSTGSASTFSATYPFSSVIQTNMLKLTVGVRFGAKSKGVVAR